ncbi:MAG: hypothetical protein Q9208_001701 [Pyrenodesmia sp. 3 TL-2023]
MVVHRIDDRAGLLPLLKSIHKPCNLKNFAGLTIGVDAYGWLHRGTVACAIDLALGKPTTKFVEFSLSRVHMLIHFGVTPYLVFDGDYLPSKAATEADRSKRREESRRLGLELHRMGKISQAHLELQKAVDVTPEMARQLIEELKEKGIQYVVAPYEADAQLAYLEKKGIIQGILSEDSDLLVFGAKRLITKLDQHGDCIEICRSDFTRCQEITMAGWTDAEFRCMAILSGCDYLASIHKMGLKTAYRKVRKYKTIERILRMLQFDGQYCVPAGYLEAFRRAELTFLHQRVFCPVADEVVMAAQLPPDTSIEDLEFLGSHIEREVALGVVNGDLHPMTKRPIVIKSKTPHTPKTPWTNTRRQTAGTPLDLKCGKPIDAYLKAYRRPLAELDPNSFTPSPTQQMVLYQSHGTWAASPAPARPSLTRSSASVPSSEARTAARRTGVGSVAGSISAPQPFKKRRLCSDDLDDEDVLQETKATVESSRFFASSNMDPSPPIDGHKRKVRLKKEKFNIWSDDSIEDVMAEIPDVSQTPKSPKNKASRALHDDREIAEQPVDVVIDTAESQTDSHTSSISQSTARTEVSAATSVTSFAESTASGSLAATLDTYVKFELESLRKKDLYQQEPERCRLQRQQILQCSSQPKEMPGLQKTGSMTPLQRLGATALNRSYSCSSSLARKAGPQESRRMEGSKAQLPKLGDILKSSQPSAIPAAPATVVKGSEDAMVPESEAESEGSQSGNGQEKPSIDLGRFAFTG